jgi:multicomponent Na+:H+ antiporter subunit G
MSILDLLTAGFLVVGSFFFVAGTVGILRFPDSLSRLHAITKADNLGLGLIVAGLALQAGGLFPVLKLLLIWLLALLASATACYVVARTATRAARGGETWPDAG